MNEYLPPPSKIGGENSFFFPISYDINLTCLVIYLHVGTNNVSTLREIKTRDLNLQEVEGCISVIRKIYTNAVLIVGCVLPRLDEENARGKELNKV